MFDEPGTVTFRLFMDGSQVYEKELTQSDEPRPLPSGHLGRQMSFEIESTRAVSGVQVAESMQELDV